jgi:hypothetical protein
LDPSISEKRVDKEDGPLWPALFGHPVQQAVLEESVKGALHI